MRLYRGKIIPNLPPKAHGGDIILMCTQAGVSQIAGAPDHHPEPEAMLRCSGWGEKTPTLLMAPKGTGWAAGGGCEWPATTGSEADVFEQPWTLPPRGAVPTDVGQG